jgi:hypothetical protein
MNWLYYLGEANIYLTRCITKVILIITLVIPLAANAQKLPNKQEISLRAPVDIKIDGKANEWGNKFQAYNKSTNTFYTISYNDSLLYLTLQATDPVIVTKIVQAGVTLTINATGKKDYNGSAAITFPFYNREFPSLYIILDNAPEKTGDTIINSLQADSFINAKNRQLAEKLILLSVTGLKVIPDGKLSINNKQVFKAASMLDNRKYYTLEMALPLIYLGNFSSKFSYNIKLNGIIAANGGQMIYTGRDDIISFRGADGKNYSAGYATPENMILAYSTDFCAEYTLAKK